MEKVERRDLPGNDASWFNALLNDQPSTPRADEAAPETATTAAADEEIDLDDELELGVILPAGSDEDPVHFPEEDLPPPPEEDLAGVAEPQEAEEGPEERKPEDLQTETEPQAPEEPDDTEESEPSSSDDESLPLMRSVPELPEDESPVETTSERVGQMWSSTATAGPLDTWAPDEMDKQISSSRMFRWTSVLAAIAVVGLILIGLVLLPSITRNRADSHRDMLTTALTDLRAELPDTQNSLKIATEPVTDPTALRGLSTQLTALTARASTVAAVSQEDLPSSPPFTSSEPIDDLEPIRQRIEPIGTTAQTIQRRIANLVEYRTLMSGFLTVPDLPSMADSATQTELRVVLASAQAESASILAELPGDVSLDPHQDLARTINERFANWQVEYLDALRTEDATVAANLVAELSTALTDLDSELVTPLAQIRRQTDTDLIDLARSIDGVSALANGDGATP